VNLLPKPRKYDDINGNSTGNRNGIKAEIRIGTWNIKMLYKLSALKNINSEIAKYKLHIVTLQEIRWLGTEMCKQKMQQYSTGAQIPIDTRKE
jgi:hypothetical protein